MESHAQVATQWRPGVRVWADRRSDMWRSYRRKSRRRTGFPTGERVETAYVAMNSGDERSALGGDAARYGRVEASTELEII